MKRSRSVGTNSRTDRATAIFVSADYTKTDRSRDGSRYRRLCLYGSGGCEALRFCGARCIARERGEGAPRSRPRRLTLRIWASVPRRRRSGRKARGVRSGSDAALEHPANLEEARGCPVPGAASTQNRARWGHAPWAPSGAMRLAAANGLPLLSAAARRRRRLSPPPARRLSLGGGGGGARSAGHSAAGRAKGSTPTTDRTAACPLGIHHDQRMDSGKWQSGEHGLMVRAGRGGAAGQRRRRRGARAACAARAEGGPAEATVRPSRWIRDHARVEQYPERPAGNGAPACRQIGQLAAQAVTDRMVARRRGGRAERRGHGGRRRRLSRIGGAAASGAHTNDIASTKPARRSGGLPGKRRHPGKAANPRRA